MKGVVSDLLNVPSIPHQKIKHSHALVCWIGPGGQCLGACLQTGPKTLAKQKIFYLVNQGVIELITPWVNKGVKWQAMFACLNMQIGRASCRERV